MAFTTPLPPELLPTIAAEIGQRVAIMPTMLKRYWKDDKTEDNLKEMKPIQVTESFPLWEIGAPGLAPEATQHWHHQVKFDGEALCYALSKPQNNTQSVTELFYSPLAMSVDQAIVAIDGNKEFNEEWEARLLSDPSHQSYVFWLLNGQTGDAKIVPVYLPYDFSLDALHPEVSFKIGPVRIYQASIFFDRMSDIPGIQPFK